MRFFETVFLDEAENFIAALDPKTIRKVLYNIDLAEQTKDPKLFKKLDREIWEFRTKYWGFKSAYLHFGIRKVVSKPWWWQRTGS